MKYYVPKQDIDFIEYCPLIWRNQYNQFIKSEIKENHYLFSNYDLEYEVVFDKKLRVEIGIKDKNIFMNEYLLKKYPEINFVINEKEVLIKDLTIKII